MHSQRSNEKQDTGKQKKQEKEREQPQKSNEKQGQAKKSRRGHREARKGKKSNKKQIQFKKQTQQKFQKRIALHGFLEPLETTSPFDQDRFDRPSLLAHLCRSHFRMPQLGRVSTTQFGASLLRRVIQRQIRAVNHAAPDM